MYMQRMDVRKVKRSNVVSILALCSEAGLGDRKGIFNRVVHGWSQMKIFEAFN